ncbi:MAG: P-loop NTPase fold protein [Paludibacteraceae bacterium]|nr:P-loop NTPase fold protein [Paludibacteraceae bacterium]
MAEPIKFYKGEETGIVHESYADINTSLFKDQYNKALSEIGSFLSANSSEFNNVFAFIGDRGTGKTSCMESVAGMLEEYNDDKRGKTFLKLQIIDPTTFNDNTNLMQVVIGVMFEEFKKEVKKLDKQPYNADEREYESKKQNLLNAFQDVKECLKYISNPDLLKCENDDISQLAGMASVSNLKKRIENLADNYLKFFEKNILVLQIDDIDLQTTYAYQMVEEIRKYFMYKNIIVLMAVKMEQLQKVIENNSAKTYEPLRKFGDKGITLPEISDMAVRYLLKLIPIEHRIFMPTFEVYADSLIEYFPNHEKEQKSLIGDGSPISVKYAVTTLIFEKCRFLFYHSKGVVSPIVPRNLRELRHLLAMMVGMPDITDENQKKDNKIIFLKYFYSTWVNNNIPAEDLTIVRNIEQVRDAALINKVVIQQLFDRYHSLFTDENDIIEPFKEILNVRNTSYNISLADVYTVVDYIRRRKSGVDDRMLVFFISTFYSFKLYEYYDELTDKIDEDAVLQSEGHKKSHPDDEIRIEEITDKINNYQVLVGGCFINTDEYKFIPKDKNQSKEKIKINFDALKEAAKAIIDEKEEWTEEKQINFIEFLILCTHRLYETTDFGYVKYRTGRDLCYDFSDNRLHKAVVFDLGAFYFNIIDVERAYNRINPNLFNKLKTNDNSLYRKLMKSCLSQRGLEERSCSEAKKMHTMLSCVAIRNYEVLSHFINKTEYNWADRSKGNLMQNLCDYFKKVSEYEIKLYFRQKGNQEQDRENRQPAPILFKYVKSVVDILENKMEDDFVKKYVYSGTDGFDVEELIQYFPSADYAPVTIKSYLHRYRIAMFKSDKKWDTLLSSLIKSKSPDEKERVSRNDIKDIINQLDLEYQKDQSSK